MKYSEILKSLSLPISFLAFTFALTNSLPNTLIEMIPNFKFYLCIKFIVIALGILLLLFSILYLVTRYVRRNLVPKSELSIQERSFFIGEGEYESYHKLPGFNITSYLPNIFKRLENKDHDVHLLHGDGITSLINAGIKPYFDDKYEVFDYEKLEEYTEPELDKFQVKYVIVEDIHLFFSSTSVKELEKVLDNIRLILKKRNDIRFILTTDFAINHNQELLDRLKIENKKMLKNIQAISIDMELSKCERIFDDPRVRHEVKGLRKEYYNRVIELLSHESSDLYHTGIYVNVILFQIAFKQIIEQQITHKKFEKNGKISLLLNLHLEQKVKELEVDRIVVSNLLKLFLNPNDQLTINDVKSELGVNSKYGEILEKLASKRVLRRLSKDQYRLFSSEWVHPLNNFLSLNDSNSVRYQIIISKSDELVKEFPYFIFNWEDLKLIRSFQGIKKDFFPLKLIYKKSRVHHSLKLIGLVSIGILILYFLGYYFFYQREKYESYEIGKNLDGFHYNHSDNIFNLWYDYNYPKNIIDSFYKHKLFWEKDLSETELIFEEDVDILPFYNGYLAYSKCKTYLIRKVENETEIRIFHRPDNPRIEFGKLLKQFPNFGIYRNSPNNIVTVEYIEEIQDLKVLEHKPYTNYQEYQNFNYLPDRSKIVLTKDVLSNIIMHLPTENLFYVFYKDLSMTTNYQLGERDQIIDIFTVKDELIVIYINYEKYREDCNQDYDFIHKVGVSTYKYNKVPKKYEYASELLGFRENKVQEYFNSLINDDKNIESLGRIICSVDNIYLIGDCINKNKKGNCIPLSLKSSLSRHGYPPKQYINEGKISNLSLGEYYNPVSKKIQNFPIHLVSDSEKKWIKEVYSNLPNLKKTSRDLVSIVQNSLGEVIETKILSMIDSEGVNIPIYVNFIDKNTVTLIDLNRNETLQKIVLKNRINNIRKTIDNKHLLISSDTELKLFNLEKEVENLSGFHLAGSNAIATNPANEKTIMLNNNSAYCRILKKAKTPTKVEKIVIPADLEYNTVLLGNNN